MSDDRISLPDYTALREGAGIGSVSARSQLAVAGKDRAAYLQGLLTNDIQAVTPGNGCYAAWLSPQGRMISDLHVLESGDMILLDVPANLAEGLLQRLDQFLFTEDVQLASLADTLRGIWIHGPGAAKLLAGVVPDAPSFHAWTDYQHARLTFDAAPVVIARIDQLGVPGFCAYLAPAQSDSFTSTLVANGAVIVSEQAIAAARIEAGYPVFGVDMTDETIPLEAGIEDRAISFSKGCYVGQEIVIRVLHRGGGRVARKLVALRVHGNVPASGSRLFAGDRDVGFITSAAASPRLGSIGLGYVHRDFTAPDTALVVASEPGPASASAPEGASAEHSVRRWQADQAQRAIVSARPMV
jgi:tRNA-modifying protein YgfZ